MTYKVAVCDDEKIFIDDVVTKLSEQSSDCEITTFLSGEELLNSSIFAFIVISPFIIKLPSKSSPLTVK